MNYKASAVFLCSASLLVAACSSVEESTCSGEECASQQVVPKDDPATEIEQPLQAAQTVDPARELLITDPSVVRSAVETTFDPQHRSGTNKKGAWSFGRLVHNMLPKAQRDSSAAASKLVMDWLKTWTVDQTMNSSVSPALARNSIRLLIINPWKKASGCAQPESPSTDASCILNMAVAPFELLAIVNRPDLRFIADDGSAIAGEGRFVFQVRGPTLGMEAASGALAVMDATPKAQKFTVIFEYALPVTKKSEVLDWAQAWHALGSVPFGTTYQQKLLAITNRFSGPDAAPSRPNGNALNQLRTNEVALMGARFPDAGFLGTRQHWELREFHLTTSGLSPRTVNLEPPRDFDIARPTYTGLEGTRSAELISYLKANEASVLDHTYILPPYMSGNSSLVGSAPYAAWGKLVNPNPPTIASSGVAHNLGDVPVAVRDAYALNTCAGCHRHETDTRHFMHLTLLEAMEPADKVDDRSRVGIESGTPENTVVVSNLLRADVNPGGGRFEDFSELLVTPVDKLANKKGLRMCARR